MTTESTALVAEIDERNKLNDLSAKEWIQETKSFVFQKGLGNASPEARYEKMHPAPFSFTDVVRLIRFFTKRKGKVLDPFVGIGSTIKACREIDREGFGIELSLEWCEVTRTRLLEEANYTIDQKHLICGDSRDVRRFFDDGFFDFIVTSPPYWNILDKKDHKANARARDGHATKYSDNDLDLGNVADYGVFLDELCRILLDCYFVLKPGGYMCVVVSDFRHKSQFVAFHADLIERLTNRTLAKHFELKGIKILLQNAKRLFPYGYPFAYVENIHHQYILILQRCK